MNPAWSVVFFTTSAGAGQGVVVTLAAATLAGVALPGTYRMVALLVALVLLVIGLLSSFFHLGHPERAWRAMAMWRTSWLSREVIVLPAFIGATGLWWLFDGWLPRWWPVLLIVLSFVLWHCTAMIYACIRFIQEWASPLTNANYVLIGLASGAIVAGALAAVMGASALAAAVAPWAVGLTLLAFISRMLSLHRNATLKPKSTPQSATGLRTAKVEQRAMGMSAGAFNTREFFHRLKPHAFRRVRSVFIVLGFVLPALLVALAMAAAGSRWPWILAVVSLVPGLVAERWFFLAQARHPQNIYYQRVS
jgi:DMSO reductase anchor subunit